VVGPWAADAQQMIEFAAKGGHLAGPNPKP